MLKKVVVVYPHRHVKPNAMASVAVGDMHTIIPELIVYVAEKTFEGDLEVLNKDSGVLVIKEVNGHEHAVFKEWIYWENLE